MADYGIGRTGGSLRDALNAMAPMLGMGEYSAAFPPTSPPSPGAPQPQPAAPAVPLPPQRPPMQPGMPRYLPPNVQAGLQPAPGLPAFPQGQTSLQASLTGEGGANTPGRLADPRMYDYAARLGLTRSF